MSCHKCGATKSSRMIKGLCSACYQRERANSVTHPLPAKGEVVLDSRGRPICHICGKAYKKLMSHVRQVHEMTAYEYKVEFGLETTKSVMAEDSKEIARKRNKENYDTVVTQNLINRGKKTRYTPGHKGRTKDMVSLQTHKSLVDRLTKKTKGE